MASFADYEQIAAVQTANSLTCESREQWEHLWLANPAYRAREGNWPIGWVLETAGGSIAGTIINVPRTYSLNGKNLTVAVARGWAVLEEYRSFSLLLLGKFISQTGVDLLLTTTASLTPAAAFTRLHWSRPPIGQWDRLGFWITGYKGFAQSCLRMLSVPCAKPLGWAAGPALALVDWLCHPSSVLLSWHSHSRAFELRCSNAFDDRFDLFWERLKADRPNVLMGVRSRDFLNWQFQSAIEQNLLWIVTACAGERLLGYGIFRRCDKPAAGLRRMRVIDVQVLEGCDELYAAILRKARARCRDEGIHVLENVGCWLEDSRTMTGPAPHHRELECWSYFYKGHGEELRACLANPDNWRPTSFDGDSGF